MCFRFLSGVFLFCICFLILVCCQSQSSIDDLPKCCDFQSSIFKENSTYVCKRTFDKQHVINVKTVVNISKKSLCVDIFESDFFVFQLEIEFNFTLKRNVSTEAFQKCCPLEYSYNYNNKSCDKCDFQSDFNASLIKVGLPQCNIIKDHLHSTYRNENRQNFNSCLDKTVSGEYVERICETVDICKSTRCIHKCCPDGKSFVNGSNCKNTFGEGLYLGHFSKNIENLTGKTFLVNF